MVCLFNVHTNTWRAIKDEEKNAASIISLICCVMQPFEIDAAYSLMALSGSSHDNNSGAVEDRPMLTSISTWYTTPVPVIDMNIYMYCWNLGQPIYMPLAYTGN